MPLVSDVAAKAFLGEPDTHEAIEAMSRATQRVVPVPPSDPLRKRLEPLRSSGFSVRRCVRA